MYKRLFPRVTAMVLAGIMTFSLTACGGDQTASTGTDGSQAAESTAAATDEESKEYQVGVILKTTSSEYWSYVMAGVDAAEEELGNVYAQVYGASSDTDYEGQINQAETILNSGTKQAIAIAPLDAGMAATVLGNADIPILAVDTNFDGASTFIGTAHEDAAYQGGQYIAEQIGEGGKVLILANIQGESTSEARVSGYTKALEEGGCEIVDVQYTDGVGDKAVNVMEGALQTHPDLDAVVCCADDVALGAARAMSSQGLTADDIMICGFDGISSGVQAVVDGTISCTVAQDPYNMGYQCVMSLVDAVDGEELPEFIDTGCSVITPDNAQEYLDKLNSLV